ncbi:hypothetical protein ABZ023_27170 [Streptomyces sp. NPDC006367]|uniref:hypothetical protein n=1 Tax=unclassified Streptomyces TaxID=2593676 RepID=UPI0033B22CB5
MKAVAAKPGIATAPHTTGLPAPALLAGALAGMHRAAVREIRRRMLSGESPARVRDAVAGT